MKDKKATYSQFMPTEADRIWKMQLDQITSALTGYLCRPLTPIDYTFIGRSAHQNLDFYLIFRGEKIALIKHETNETKEITRVYFEAI